MKLQSIHQFFKTLNKDNQGFVFRGNFDNDIIEKIIDLSVNNTSEGAFLKLSNRLSFLMAECFQNVVRHGIIENEEPDIIPKSFFITRDIDSSFYIFSANPIENDNSDLLKFKLENLNKLNPDELKILYRQILTNDTMSEKGGAGLGLIEMARKSKQKLEFDFEIINDVYSYFYLQIKIKDNENAPPGDYLEIGSSMQMKNILEDNNILLAFKGNFSQTTIFPILKMIDNDLQHQMIQYRRRKKTYHLLVEVLQNISRHGEIVKDKREAIFIIG
ncbi:MAG: SiaB family protein kinase [Bacteroidota bacterium]